jgi:hypothetical protein
MDFQKGQIVVLKIGATPEPVCRIIDIIDGSRLYRLENVQDKTQRWRLPDTKFVLAPDDIQQRYENPKQRKDREQKERQLMTESQRDEFIQVILNVPIPFRIDVEVDAELIDAQEKTFDEYKAWTGQNLDDLSCITFVANKARGLAWWNEWRVSFSHDLPPAIVALCPELESHIKSHKNRISLRWCAERLIRQGFSKIGVWQNQQQDAG